MKTLSVLCYYDAATALTLGMAQSGPCLFPLTEENLAALTLPERTRLTAYATEDTNAAEAERAMTWDNILRPVTRLDWEAVLTALRVVMAKEEAEKTAKIRGREEAARKVLAFDAEAPLTGEQRETLGVACGALSYWDNQKLVPGECAPSPTTDLRVLDWLERAKANHARRAAEKADAEEAAKAIAQAEADVFRAERAVRQAAEAAEATLRKAALLAWAEARSARVRSGIAEGYAMQNVALELLDEALLAVFGSTATVYEDSSLELKKRSDVSEAALAILRTVREAASKADLPQGVRLQVGPISRMSIFTHSEACLATLGECIEDEDGGCGTTHRTVVPVDVLDVAGGTRQVIVAAE